MRIRRARPEDASGIAAVHVAAWHEAYRGLFSDAAIASRSLAIREAQWQRQLARPEDKAPQIWVAEEEGRLVGFISAGRCLDQNAAPRLGEVYTLYLEPAQIGRGVGRALMDEALQGLRQRGFSEAVLWVLDRNERAQRFYRAAGFEWDGGERWEDELEDRHRDLRYHRTL